jgi:hypothetical protein
MSHTQPERRLKLLYVGMRYDYGIPARGLSFEHCNFFDVLTHMGFDILYFDFLDLQRRHGQVRIFFFPFSTKTNSTKTSCVGFRKKQKPSR